MKGKSIDLQDHIKNLLRMQVSSGVSANFDPFGKRHRHMFL
jgi:hypothetical protein